MRRGELWWASLPAPRGAGPGYRRPVLVIQSNDFNQSPIRTVVIVAITTNARLAAAPGNVLLTRKETRLARESVANVSQVLTVDKGFLTERIGRVPPQALARIDDGLRLVLSL